MGRTTDRVRLAAYLAGWRQYPAQTEQALRETSGGEARGAPATDPVFVIGAPRSGTSVLGWALNEHPDFSCNHESEVLIQQFGFGRLQTAYLRSYERKDAWLAQHNVSLATYARYLGQGVSGLYAEQSGDARWVDTTPRQVLFARELALLFPDARFIVLLRNGAQVVNSLVHSNFNVWSAQSFALAAWTWRTYVSAALAFEQLCPTRCHIVRHEQLRNHDPSIWPALFEFLEAEAVPECQAFLDQNVINSSFTTSADNVNNGPAVPPGSPTWSRYHRVVFNAIAGRLMQSLNYDAD